MKFFANKITYTCPCGEVAELLPDYLKYVVEYQDMERGAALMCPGCDKAIPTRKLYKEYLKGGEENANKRHNTYGRNKA